MNKDDKLKLYKDNKKMLNLINGFGGIMGSVNLRDICLKLKYYKNKTAFYNTVSELIEAKLIAKSNNYIYLLKFSLSAIKNVDIKDVKSVNIRASKNTLDLMKLKEKLFLQILENRDNKIDFEKDYCSFFKKDINYLNSIKDICSEEGFNREFKIYNNNKAYKCSFLNNNKEKNETFYDNETTLINILSNNKKVIIRRIKDFKTKVRLTVMILDYNNTLTYKSLNNFILTFNSACSQLFGANRFSVNSVNFVIVKNCIKYKELKTNFNVKYLNLYSE